MSTHPIVHIELPSDDPEKAARFYEEMFGWPMEHAAQFDYWTFATEPNRGGGFNKIDPNSPIGFPIKGGETIIYVEVDDIDAGLTKAESLGGQIMTPNSDIPGVGSFGIFRDPSGNLIGLFKK